MRTSGLETGNILKRGFAYLMRCSSYLSSNLLNCGGVSDSCCFIRSFLAFTNGFILHLIPD